MDRHARHAGHARAGEAAIRAERHAGARHGHRHHGHTNATMTSMAATPAATAVTTTAAAHKPPGISDPFWNPSTSGNGTWDTSTLNWNTAQNGTGTQQAWPSGGDATFSATGKGTGAYTVTVSGTISANSITVSSGTLTLAGMSTPALTIHSGGVMINNTVAGTVTFDSSLGTVQAGIPGGSGGENQTWANNSTQSFLVNSGVQIGKATTLTLGGSGSGSISGVISEASSSGANVGKLAKSGTGTWVLSGANTYSGATTINQGTLQFAKEVALYNNVTTKWTAANIVVASGATAAFNVGGTGEFTSANIDTLKALGTASGGFESGSILGLDTTNASGGNFTYSSVIANPNSGANVLGLTKLGTNTLTLNGASTYTGATTINAGKLTLDNNNTITARLAGTSGITVNSGGTLMLSQTGVASNDRINNSATVTLNGGTFNINKLSEGATGSGGVGIGALTLQANSIIDFGSGSTTSILHFAASNLATWTAGKLLSIDDWSGSINGGSTEELLVGIDSTGLTASQLAEIQFVDPVGFAPGVYGARILSTGEVVPLPEPSTWIAGGLALAVLGYTQYRRRSQVGGRRSVVPPSPRLRRGKQ